MNYPEAWDELRDKLYKARQSLNGLIRELESPVHDHYKRLNGKRQGIDLAIEYMLDIEKLLVKIDSPETSRLKG